MSNITFHVELDSYKKKDGTHNLQIRITQNRKSKRITTGLSILPNNWNPEKCEVRKADPQYRQKNALLKSKMLELESTYLEASIQDKALHPEKLILQLRREVVGSNFFEYAKTRIARMSSPSTRKGMSSVVKKLYEYRKSDQLFFSQINYEFILNYERYLKKQGNGINTIHSSMKSIKAIYNEALKTGQFDLEGPSPWSLYKLKKAKSKRRKLDELQIIQIEQLDIRPGINKWHSRNIFLMSFFLQGMRAADIIQLKWGQVKNDRVEYISGKTGKFRSKKLIPRATEILAHYRYPGLRATDYVFPFLKSKNKKQFSEDEWLGAISSTNTIINKHLRAIAVEIGIDGLSMHVARHSFADIARKKTGDVYAVSNALDHSSVTITENYFNAASRAENDDLVDSVFG
ncbi:site-specific recombinase XerC [Dyadobacter jejuensis]|uniref:Site-specific recombinase XerC n=1 Tax=Dyadobacter jejuensis TaxID=1082580 RepID=A0A316B980_9BACT|nr:site-specific integrase [Dyadobacter jejuensis]PWJ59097.1 site-specific recombinase XerC [Dyadobacter jejuensis]